MAEEVAVQVQAAEAIVEVRQIKTMADYSVNVVLNFPEQYKSQAKCFMDWQGKLVHVVAMVEE